LECGEHRRFGFLLLDTLLAPKGKIQSGDARRTPKRRLTTPVVSV
jgi:hypothetical protein